MMNDEDLHQPQTASAAPVQAAYIGGNDLTSPGKDGFMPKELIALFVRTFHGMKREYDDFLVATAAEFWPTLQHQQLEVVLDANSTRDTEMGESIQGTWPYPDVSYLSVPDDLRDIGQVLQQESYFYADVFTKNRSEFVGMVDTDTLFTRMVQKRDIFDPANGKPVIIAQIGVPEGHFWATVPGITAEVLKLDRNSTLRGMAYFPVVVKSAHLKAFRSHVEALHGMPFATAWRQAWIRSRNNNKTIFGAFDLIVTFLWHYHRDEYSFRLQRRRGVNDHAPVFDSIIEQSPNLTIPFPRVSEHAHYREPFPRLRLGAGKGKTQLDWTLAERDRIILRGKCLSSACLSSSLDCAMYFNGSRKDLDARNKELGNAMWTFEGSDWRFDERAAQIQDKLWPLNQC